VAREVSAGERLDQFEVTELIARSGMASIFKAKDSIGGATVALKVPYMQFESDVVFYERFRREEQIGQRLDHPNIIKVLKPVRKSRMYLAMEYFEGLSMRALLRGNQPIDSTRALNFARQICDALIYMHAQRIVHRDLKPENILVGEDDRIKMMDFGIALDESARRLTWAGLSTTVGTPDYMAPEQVGGRRGDVRTDIYALGTILYEMLTGNLPYSGANVYAMMKAKASEDPPRLSEFVPDIDPGLEEIVLHAIERVPRNRYASAAELMEDLRDPSRVVHTGRAEKLLPRGVRTRRLGRMLMTGVFVLSLVAVCFLVVWLANRFPAAQGSARTPYHGTK